jgi:glycerol kinase
MQIQADISGIELARPSMLETTALGAALAAGLAVGIWSDLKLFKSEATVMRFVPKLDDERRVEMVTGWKKALEKSFDWA